MNQSKIQIHKPLTRETLELTAPEGIEIISAKGVQTYNPITGHDHVDLDVRAVDQRPLESFQICCDVGLPEPKYEAGLPRRRFDVSLTCKGGLENLPEQDCSCCFCREREFQRLANTRIDGISGLELLEAGYAIVEHHRESLLAREQAYVMDLIARAQEEAIRSLNNARAWWEPRVEGVALYGTIDFDRKTITVKDVVVIKE